MFHQAPFKKAREYRNLLKCFLLLQTIFPVYCSWETSMIDGPHDSRPYEGKRVCVPKKAKKKQQGGETSPLPSGHPAQGCGGSTGGRVEKKRHFCRLESLGNKQASPIGSLQLTKDRLHLRHLSSLRYPAAPPHYRIQLAHVFIAPARPGFYAFHRMGIDCLDQ